MTRIGIVGPRPKDGSLLTKKDGKVWNELKTVLAKDLESSEWNHCTFLIPIYSKFDIEILRICEQKGRKVEFYLPNPEWGKTKLPRHNLLLIERMSASPTHVFNGAAERMNKMIEDSDGLYCLRSNINFGPLEPAMKGVPQRDFPIQNMRYTTEEEAMVHILNQKTQVSQEQYDSTLPIPQIATMEVPLPMEQQDSIYPAFKTVHYGDSLTSQNEAETVFVNNVEGPIDWSTIPSDDLPF